MCDRSWTQKYGSDKSENFCVKMYWCIVFWTIHEGVAYRKVECASVGKRNSQTVFSGIILPGTSVLHRNHVISPTDIVISVHTLNAPIPLYYIYILDLVVCIVTTIYNPKPRECQPHHSTQRQHENGKLQYHGQQETKKTVIGLGSGGATFVTQRAVLVHWWWYVFYKEIQ